jgi:hypothetical protein
LAIAHSSPGAALPARRRTPRSAPHDLQDRSAKSMALPSPPSPLAHHPQAAVHRHHPAPPAPHPLPGPPFHMPDECEVRSAIAVRGKFRSCLVQQHPPLLRPL